MDRTESRLATLGLIVALAAGVACDDGGGASPADVADEGGADTATQDVDDGDTADATDAETGELDDTDRDDTGPDDADGGDDVDATDAIDAETGATDVDTSSSDAGDTGEDTDIGGCFDDDDCQDGLFCNGVEVCTGATDDTPGTCGSGEPVADDGIDCTVDTCDDELDTVTHEPNGAACDDGFLCTGVDTCDVEVGCVVTLALDVDVDADGFTAGGGDCDECDPWVNPMALELPGDSVDNDCDTEVDEAPATCDADLSLADVDPIHAAAAIDLCRVAAHGGDWGVVSAAYVRANGSARTPGAEVGLLSAFGTNITPVSGASMLGLSSGRARGASSPGACGSESCATLGAGTPPPGFPQAVPGCPGTESINDDIGLQVTLRAPSNVTGFEVSYLFVSFEFPEWVCTQFNDQFIVLTSPPPAGAINGNVAFDAATTPISVNASYVSHCDPLSEAMFAASCSLETLCPAPPVPYCPHGSALMDGTGYNEWTATYSGATGWLRTRAPVEPGQEFTVRFAIWDAGDQTVDSMVVIDEFRWLIGDVVVATEPRP